MKACIVLLVLVLPAVAGAAEDEFTEAELEQVQSYQSQLEKVCRDGIDEKIRSTTREVPSVTRWIAEITSSGDYCGCASRHFAGNITAPVLRSADHQQLAAVVKKSGAECIVPLIKSSFPAFCQELVAEAAKQTTAELVDSTAFCECVQADVDTVTVDSFDTFVTGDQFPASMKRCAQEKLKVKGTR